MVYYSVKRYQWASEMVQQIKALVTKPDHLSLIPRIHMVERENQLLQVVLCPTHTHTHAQI